MAEPIAERRIFAISSKGEKLTFRVVVGRPYQVNDVSWACSVRIDGLGMNLCDMVGIDSWQALGLAINLARQLLGHFLENGGKLYWEEGGGEMTLDDLFPRLNQP